jgi:hypothetical protein
MKKRFLVLLAVVVSVASLIVATPAQAAVNWLPRVTDGTTITPGGDSGYTIHTWWFVSAEYPHLKRLSTFQVVKTSGPCGILGVTVRSPQFPGDDQTLTTASTGNTGIKGFKSSWQHYNTTGSITLTYYINTICGLAVAETVVVQ